MSDAVIINEKMGTLFHQECFISNITASICAESCIGMFYNVIRFILNLIFCPLLPFANNTLRKQAHVIYSNFSRL